MIDSKPISPDEVQLILRLVDELDKSSFEFIRLEIGGLKLSIGKSEADFSRAATPPAPAAAPPPAAAAVTTAAPPTLTAAAPVAAAVDGSAPVKAPIVGIFYAAPEPGAPPYVQVGQLIEPDTTVALIEVMKVFTAVKSGVRGTVKQVCVANAQFVEYGQTLFLVAPQ